MTLVLVIDRDAHTRLVARRTLERAGFAVTTAANDGDIADGEPDLVVADLAIASLTVLREHHPELRVLALTHAGEEPAGPRVAATLTKPFTASELLGAVRRCLAR